MNIINGIEKSFNSSSKVKSSIFSDDQVLFSGDNVVMFSKNTSINSMNDFQNYVGKNVVKTSWGKYISVYKKEPSSGTSNGTSLTMPKFSVSEKLLFDFSSLGSGFSLLNDRTSSTSYTNQPFLGGIFTLDIGYRYENKWLCNRVTASGSINLKIYTDSDTIYQQTAYFTNITMPWDKSDHTTGVHLYWTITDDVTAKLNTAISSGKQVYVTLSDGSFSMSTNSKSCYLITVNNFKFIPKTSTSTISNYSDSPLGYKWGYASGASDLSNIKVMASTESGLAVVICSNGIIVGTNTQAYKYTGNGASALS
jgi:hypothetical protein